MDKEKRSHSKIDENNLERKKTKPFPQTEDRFNMLSNEKRNTDDNNAIDFSERMKPIKFPKQEAPVQEKTVIPHVPVRVHVPKRPTESDLNRVYNPYTAQDEYESYMKNGFLFEPLKGNNNNNNMSTFSVHSTSITSKTPVNESNISIRSETFAPLKNKNFEKKKSYTNKTYESDTEFKNLNKLKSSTIISANKVDMLGKSQISKGSTSNIKATIVNDNDSDIINSSNHRNAYENKFYYDDEYDIANRYQKTNKKSNTDMLSSINQEIRRIKTGLDENSSKA